MLMPFAAALNVVHLRANTFNLLIKTSAAVILKLLQFNPPTIRRLCRHYPVIRNEPSFRTASQNVDDQKANVALLLFINYSVSTAKFQSGRKADIDRSVIMVPRYVQATDTEP
eukprot:IDg11607t1